MSYEKHNWTDNETITAAKLNNIEDGIEEAAQSGGGGGYDLVIDYDTISNTGTIVSGNILDCEDKVDNGELVNAVAVIHADFSYTPTGANTNKNSYFLPLVRLMGAYQTLLFGAVIDDEYAVASYKLLVSYDPATGSVESYAYLNHLIWEN